jgi:hypothetical protein
VNGLDFVAMMDLHVRETVVYPKAARLERLLRELAEVGAERRDPNRRRWPLCWLGAHLVGLGTLLLTVGRWFATSISDVDVSAQRT